MYMHSRNVFRTWVCLHATSVSSDIVIVCVQVNTHRLAGRSVSRARAGIAAPTPRQRHRHVLLASTVPMEVSGLLSSLKSFICLPY